MMGGIVSAAFFPVPLCVYKSIGKENHPLFLQMHEAMQKAAEAIKKSNPQTVVVLSRYRFTLADAIGISPQARLRGNLENHGDSSIAVGYDTDLTLTREIRRYGDRMGIPIVDILSSIPTVYHDDHLLHYSAVLPLHYLQQAGLGSSRQLVRLTMGRLSYEEMFAFGQTMQKAAVAANRRVAIITAANMLPVRPITKNDGSLDSNLVAMQAMGDKKPILLHQLGYPPEEEYAFRCIAFLLGSVSGLNAKPNIYRYETINDKGYGLMQYNIESK